MKPPLPKNLEKSGFVYATKIWSVKGRIKCVKILGIKIILDYAQTFAEIINLSKCLETPLFTGFRALSFILGF